MRLISSIVALSLLAAPVAAQMKPEERSILQSEVRAYLLEHPEVIMEALQLLEQRQQLAEANADIQLVADNSEQIFNDGYSHVGGNPEGDITVVEFLDYSCGFCKRAHNEVKALLEADPNIRYVVKEFPILGPVSRRAAVAALASMQQSGPDVYAAYNDRLMSHEGRLTDNHVYSIAAEVGLDVDRLRSDMESPVTRDQVEQTYALAQTLRIQGTPAFIIGDTIVRGFIPLAQLQETVDLARRVQN